MRGFVILLGLLCLAALPAAAQEPAHDFGLAMHGKPLYGPQDQHLAYVNPAAPKGGVLRMAGIGTFDTLNPFTLKGRAPEGLQLVYDRLMTRVWDEPFTLYPQIAAGYVVAPDRSGITFFLDPRARFQDGSPVTADDVLFTFETLREFGRPNMRRMYKLVTRAEKRDDRTVSFSFGPGFDQETALIIAMMPVLSKADWQGKNFDQTTLQAPMGSGPYRIAQVEAGRSITYERVKDYWGTRNLTARGQYNFERVIYDYFRDDTVAFEAFKSGALNLRREYDAGKWASAYKDLPALARGDIVMDSLPHGRPEKTRGFIFNTRRAPFDDIRVRKALSLLLDFEWANANLFHGQYKRIGSFFPNSDLAARGAPEGLEMSVLERWRGKIDESVPGPLPPLPQSATPAQRRENMRAADALLKEAGWSVTNGRRMKDGKALSFEIILSAPEDEKIALHFKRALEQMGISPLIRVLDSAAYLGRLNEYDFDMTLYYWLSTLSPGTEQVLYWGCAAASEKGRFNYAGVCDPAVDALAAGIAAAKTREDLVAHVRALDRVLLHGYYMIPLYYRGADDVAYARGLRRPEKTPLYGAVLESWWMDPPPLAKQD